VLPVLPLNEKNSPDHHNSYNKGPNLMFFSFTESPSNSLFTIKFPKNYMITSSYHRNLSKTAKAIYGIQRAIGVEEGTKVCTHRLDSDSQYNTFDMPFYCQKTTFICDFQHTSLWNNFIFFQCSTPLVDTRFIRYMPNLVRSKNMKSHNPYQLQKMVFWPPKLCCS
jgi:hypothetical protein